MNHNLTFLGTGWISHYFLTKFHTFYKTINTLSRLSKKPKESNKHYYNDLYNPTPLTYDNADTCIITFPFSRTLTDPNSYYEGIKAILPIKELKKFNKVIFTSSTSIYPNNNSIVTEETPIQSSPRAIALHNVEQYLLHHSKQAYILRLSGICGGTRRSERMTSKKIIKYALTPMNLIHINDIIEIMFQLSNTKTSNSDILNVSCNDHPTRSEYYRHICHLFNKSIPTFDNLIDAHKIVCNKKLINKYDISLQFPSPLAFTFCNEN